jgi:IS30 family transposase
MAVQRGKRPRLKNPFIRDYVVGKLKDDFSPEQISGRLTLDHPGYSISPEAIYQFIYAQYKRGGFGECVGIDLRKCLKRRHKVRRPKHAPFAKETGKIQGITRISERPGVVNERSRVGDWEGDSMVSRKSPSGLNTLVERKSGYVMISKIKRVTKNETTAAVVRRLSQVPKGKRLTLTVDNGPENAGHQDLAAFGLDVYFANPYHSWERGSNENANGLIRHYLPKGTDFATIDERTIQAIEGKLNDRPRKRLKWKTPREIFNQGVALEH